MLSEQGNLAEASEYARALVVSGRTRRAPLDQGRGHRALAEVQRRAGDLDAAEAEIETALVLLRVHCPLDVSGALATLAALRQAQG